MVRMQEGAIPTSRQNAVAALLGSWHSSYKEASGADHRRLVGQRLPGVPEGGAPARLAEVDGQLVLLVFDALVRLVLEHVGADLHMPPHSRPVQGRVLPLHGKGLCGSSRLIHAWKRGVVGRKVCVACNKGLNAVPLAWVGAGGERAGGGGGGFGVVGFMNGAGLAMHILQRTAAWASTHGSPS